MSTHLCIGEFQGNSPPRRLGFLFRRILFRCMCFVCFGVLVCCCVCLCSLCCGPDAAIPAHAHEVLVHVCWDLFRIAHIGVLVRGCAFKAPHSPLCTYSESHGSESSRGGVRCVFRTKHLINVWYMARIGVLAPLCDRNPRKKTFNNKDDRTVCEDPHPYGIFPMFPTSRQSMLHHLNGH